MNDLNIIQTLSEIVEKQNIIIRRQAEAIAQLGGVCMEEEVKEVNSLVKDCLGIGEDE